MVLDGLGVPVWYARADGPVFDVDEVVPGAISFVADLGFRILALDPPGDTRLPALPDDQHELQRLPDGDYVTTTGPLVTGVDLTGLSVTLADGTVQALGPDSTIVDCALVELDPGGHVVWRWRATDHFDAVLDSTWPRLSGSIVDVFHCNSIDVDSASGDLLVSARHMDSVFEVDKATGRVLWKMGGASYTKDDAPYVPVADPFHRQHDARFGAGWSATCSGGAGSISLFDDETDLPGPARAVIYDVRVGAPGDAGAGIDCGAPAAPGATVTWQRAGIEPSTDMGSFRLLSDGSRVIGWGVGDEGHAATEVDVAGNDRLDIDVDGPGADASYRVIKVPLSALDLEVLRRTAGR
jgi:hypothetical protein